MINYVSCEFDRLNGLYYNTTNRLCKLPVTCDTWSACCIILLYPCYILPLSNYTHVASCGKVETRPDCCLPGTAVVCIPGITDRNPLRRNTWQVIESSIAGITHTCCIRRYIRACMKLTSFAQCSKVLSSGRGCFLALSAEGHAEGPPVHHGASVGPRRSPWRVLWACKVAISGKLLRDGFPTSHSQPGPCNPPQTIYIFFAIFHLSMLLFFQVPQQWSKVRQSRYNSRASSFSLCGSRERCVCVWVVSMCVRVSLWHPTSVGNRDRLKNRDAIWFFRSFQFCYWYVCGCCCGVPVPHRKLLKLWQPRCNSSRTSRYPFRDSYERCFCECVCALCGRAILNTTRGNSNPHFLRI